MTLMTRKSLIYISVYIYQYIYTSVMPKWLITMPLSLKTLYRASRYFTTFASKCPILRDRPILKGVFEGV